MNRLVPPIDLADVDWFIVIWDRDEERFILVLRDRSSFTLHGDSFPLEYLKRALNGNEYLAGRVLDTARNFVAAVCYPELNDAVACPEKFVPSKTETDILFDEANREPWPALLAHR